jgi:hypothetical protein
MQILIPEDELSVESTQSSPLHPVMTHFGAGDPDKLITPESIKSELRTMIRKNMETMIIIRLFTLILFDEFLFRIIIQNYAR